VVNFNNEFFKYSAKILDTISGQGENGPMQRIYSDVEQKVARNNTDKGYVGLTFCSKENELEEVVKAIQNAIENGAELSDIAVLVRSNASGGLVASYLIENGYAVVTDDSLKVKNSITVRRLMALMAYLVNPEDSISSYLAESLEVQLPDMSASLIDIAEYLIRSLKENGTDTSWKGELPYIQSFMDCLQDYVSSNGNNLRGFVKYWDGEDPSISSPSSGNSIRVMTIHKSKGLDFPYVILPFAENITFYKADSHWCAPDLEGTVLSGVADGVYDVNLSGSSESTLFAEHYRKERFLQQVDNINTIYVAMTRAALGVHVIAKTPSNKVLAAIETGSVTEFSDFSQMLYDYAYRTSLQSEEGEDVKCFTYGEMPDFKALRKKESYDERFVVTAGGGYPSIPLNPQEGDVECDVRERGRLKFSADSIDFFSEEGQAGIDASNRIKGIVLHDILASVIVPEDLEPAVMEALYDGLITDAQAPLIIEMLGERIKAVKKYAWFDVEPADVLNEISLIDTDGQVYRPDRVIRTGDKVMIVDYKFGEHFRKYERQMNKYVQLWHRMGYDNVYAFLWYIHTGEVIQVGASFKE
jgi:ATP-dependent exoDNAse (exonuclease V) beta subunit